VEKSRLPKAREKVTRIKHSLGKITLWAVRWGLLGKKKGKKEGTVPLEEQKSLGINGRDTAVCRKKN